MPTYPLTLPTGTGFKDAKLTLLRQTSVSTSIFTGKTQRGEQPMALWLFDGKLILMEDEKLARDWRATIVELHGQIGTFQLPVPGYVSPSTGYSDSAGLIFGASQTGLSLNTDGWAISSLIFNRGDYFTVNNELKIVAQSNGLLSAVVTAGGSGYSINDVLTVIGGTGVAAKLTVTGVSADAVTTVALRKEGSYTINPLLIGGAATGAGTGATFDFTMQTLEEYNSDVDGEMGVTFEAILRTSPANNAPLVIINPFSVMRLVNDDVGWQLSPPVLHAIGFRAIEDF